VTWSVHPALEVFHQFRDRWDALNAVQNSHILLDSGFVSILLNHSGSRDVVLAVNEDAGSPAMALLQRKASGIWETFQPSWAPLGLFLCGVAEHAGENVLSLMRSLPGYAIQLSVLQQDPDYSMFSATDNCDWTEKSDYSQTARISLQGTFQEYWDTREGKFRKNNDRRRRRLAEIGSPEFAVILDSAGVEDAIREFGRLESKGWKANGGTAVAADNAQGRLYRAVLEYFCKRNEGVIYQLRINGQVIATDLCVVRGEMLVLLKNTYDEEWSTYAPGVLLREDIVRSLYAEGRVRDYEFYGPLMEYQLNWTRNIRTLYHLTCFRYPWVRTARNFAKRIRSRPPTG
jgi:hypothetical protein